MYPTQLDDREGKVKVSFVCPHEIIRRVAGLQTERNRQDFLYAQLTCLYLLTYPPNSPES